MMNILTGEQNMEDVEMPAAVTRLMARAEQHDWRVKTRTAVGEWKGRPVHVVVLWLSRDPLDGEKQSLAALWENGKFSSAWQAWTPDPEVGGVSPRRLGSRELTAAVTS